MVVTSAFVDVASDASDGRLDSYFSVELELKGRASRVALPAKPARALRA
jgi:hypothetical protein